MAPKKPKRPSMLERQRQLRAQQQQVKQASANKLPPGKKGGDVAKPAAKPPAGAPKALPPGNRGGALATRPTTSPSKPQPKPPAQRSSAIEKAGPTIDVKANTPKLGAGKPPTGGSTAGGGVRAVGTALGRAGSAVGFLGTAAATLDQARRVFNPKDNLLTSLQQLGRDVSKATGDRTPPGGRPGYRQRGGATNSNNKPAKPVADYRDAQGNLYDGNTGRLKQAAPPRSTAPTRSNGGNPPAPGSTRRQPSSGGGSSAPSRPSAPSSQRAAAPKPAEQSAPAKPKVTGPNIGPQASGANYGESLKIGQQLSGNNDQPDMERRRAFLDAKDSMSGAKAVRDLQEKRKKRLAELNK